MFSCLVTAVRFQWPRWPVFAREFFDVAEMMDRLPHTSPCCLGLADRTADRKGPDLTHLGKMRVALVPIHDSSSSSKAVTYYVSAIFVGTRLTIGAPHIVMRNHASIQFSYISYIILIRDFPDTAQKTVVVPIPVGEHLGEIPVPAMDHKAT